LLKQFALHVYLTGEMPTKEPIAFSGVEGELLDFMAVAILTAISPTDLITFFSSCFTIFFVFLWIFPSRRSFPTLVSFI